MPPRLFPFSSPLIARLRQSFHATAIRRDAIPQPNHYETLQIPTNASASEVKKSFYALSKTHHPDLNPSDPSASQRFVAISKRVRHALLAHQTLSLRFANPALRPTLPFPPPSRFLLLYIYIQLPSRRPSSLGPKSSTHAVPRPP
ncbi:Chaperone protein DnaJ, partial [Lachnellula subtilissima]